MKKKKLLITIVIIVFVLDIVLGALLVSVSNKTSKAEKQLEQISFSYENQNKYLDIVGNLNSIDGISPKAAALRNYAFTSYYMFSDCGISDPNGFVTGCRESYYRLSDTLKSNAEIMLEEYDKAVSLSSTLSKKIQSAMEIYDEAEALISGEKLLSYTEELQTLEGYKNTFDEVKEIYSSLSDNDSLNIYDNFIKFYNDLRTFITKYFDSSDVLINIDEYSPVRDQNLDEKSATKLDLNYGHDIGLLEISIYFQKENPVNTDFLSLENGDAMMTKYWADNVIKRFE